MPGVLDIEFRADDDTFTLSFRPDAVSVDQFLTRIRELGYQPSVLVEDDPRGSEPVSGATRSGELPPLVAAAHDQAKQQNQLLLIDFHAVWCGPCKVLEREVFKHPEARSTLGKLTVLKIDTDENPDVARQFEVAGLPTLVVLDTDGGELFRHVGTISRADLLEALELLIAGVAPD